MVRQLIARPFDGCRFFQIESGLIYNKTSTHVVKFSCRVTLLRSWNGLAPFNRQAPPQNRSLPQCDIGFQLTHQPVFPMMGHDLRYNLNRPIRIHAIIIWHRKTFQPSYISFAAQRIRGQSCTMIRRLRKSKNGNENRFKTNHSGPDHPGSSGCHLHRCFPCSI